MKLSQVLSLQNKTNAELIEMIENKNNTIIKLLNENVEKENMIDVLMVEFKNK